MDSKGGKKSRFINIVLSSMQMFSPFVTEVVLIIAMGQLESLSTIIKGFVSLGFVTRIDDMFSENFPNEIKDTAKNIELVIGKDANTNKKIMQRLTKANQGWKGYKEAAMNFFVNGLYIVITNFYIVVYYYFFPLVCLFL